MWNGRVHWESLQVDSGSSSQSTGEESKLKYLHEGKGVLSLRLRGGREEAMVVVLMA